MPLTGSVGAEVLFFGFGEAVGWAGDPGLLDQMIVFKEADEGTGE